MKQRTVYFLKLSLKSGLMATFHFEEKNLLIPRECFSGVGVEAEEDDPDLVGRCLGFFELIGDLRGLTASVLLDGLKGELYIFGDSPPVLCELLPSSSSPVVVGSSSVEPSPF